MAFYRDVGNDYCQGDLIDDVPSIHLKVEPSLTALRKGTVKGNRQIWDILSSNPQPTGPKPDFKMGEVVPAFCQISRAILLTRDCEIDKDPNHRLVALVRPLARIAPADRDIVRENRNFSYFYLPADEDRGLIEAYVDFRRITCVAPELVAKGRRLASLTEESAKALMGGLFQFLTHREVIDPKNIR